MMNYKQAVEQLFYWQHDQERATNFHAILFSLIAKADQGNRAAIRRGFPSEVQAWEDWQASPSETEFFQAFGVTR